MKSAVITGLENESEGSTGLPFHLNYKHKGFGDEQEIAVEQYLSAA